MAKKPEEKWYKNPLTYSVIWLLLVAAFILGQMATGNGQYSSAWGAFFGITFIAGVLSFLLMIVTGLYKLSHSHAGKPIGYAFAIAIFLFGMGLLFFVLLGQGLGDNLRKKFTTQQANKMITCYVNGKKIMATEADCQALSVQQQQQAPEVRVIQQPVQQAPQIKMPEPPEKCVTQEEFGRIVTRCSKSWF